jgi:hypothetical protein
MFIKWRTEVALRVIIATVILQVAFIGGCATQPVDGGFQQVCDKLVAMNPLDRASNMSANGKWYEQIYGIYYDSLTDALYTKTASGDRDYILKGSLIHRCF